MMLKDRPLHTKPCPDCGVNSRALFYLDSTGRKTNARCKPCHKKHMNEYWHSKSPVEKQASRVKSMYGITADEYIEMHKSQKGKCAICNEVPTTKRGLHVDHCHETGTVRGLLCHSCNTALGSFCDDVRMLQKAITYLGG